MKHESQHPWWSTINTEELANLHQRVTKHVDTFRSLPLQSREDAVQTAFVKLFQRRKEVCPDNEGLLRFLLVCARNALLDELRRKHLPQKTMSEPEAVSDLDTQAAAEQTEFSQILPGFLRELPELDRYILWKHVIDRQSVQSIARETGLYWHRVAEILSDTLLRLRRNLDAPDRRT